MSRKSGNLQWRILGALPPHNPPPPPPPTDQNFFKFMVFFRKCLNILGRRPPLPGVSTSSYDKSWIRPWLDPFRAHERFLCIYFTNCGAFCVQIREKKVWKHRLNLNQIIFLWQFGRPTTRRDGATRRKSQWQHGMTINDLPVPQGSWKEGFDKRNRTWNMYFVSGLVTLCVATYVVIIFNIKVTLFFLWNHSTTRSKFLSVVTYWIEF